jgi:hypothetical protein
MAISYRGFMLGLMVHDVVDFRPAGVAQLVEQLIRNQQVRGSSPRAGSKTLTNLAVRIINNDRASLCAAYVQPIDDVRGR